MFTFVAGVEKAAKDKGNRKRGEKGVNKAQRLSATSNGPAMLFFPKDSKEKRTLLFQAKEEGLGVKLRGKMLAVEVEKSRDDKRLGNRAIPRNVKSNQSIGQGSKGEG